MHLKVLQVADMSEVVDNNKGASLGFGLVAPESSNYWVELSCL